VVRLVELGADINLGSESDSTAMHFAGAYGHLETVDQLLKLGADPTRENEDGETAYAIANMKVCV
jgi:ankyrin repeat protein